MGDNVFELLGVCLNFESVYLYILHKLFILEFRNRTCVIKDSKNNETKIAKIKFNFIFFKYTEKFRKIILLRPIDMQLLSNYFDYFLELV